MAAETHCCVFTRGEFYMRDAIVGCDDGLSNCSTGKPFKKIGNVSSGLVEIQGTVVGRQNEFNFGDPESRIEISAVNLTLSISCASVKNLRNALFSETPAIDDGNFVEEFCVPDDGLSSDDFFPFKFKGASSVIVTLRDDMSDIETLVLGTDYLLNSSGIQIIRDDIDVIDADFIRISYAYDTAGYEDIDFLTTPPKYKELYFKGINHGDEGEELFDAVFHQVLFGPINAFDLITRDEFLTIPLIGTVEKSNGKWFKLTKEE